MNQQLVIKLTAGDGTGVPVGLVESPPMLYTNLKQLFPTVEFSENATPSEVEPYWYGVFEWAYFTEVLPHTQSADSIGLTKHDDGVWRDTFVVRDASAEEIVSRTEAKESDVRRQRNKLLRQSDWTQLPDAQITQEKVSEYATYRQALRDVPAQAGFPWSVTFPEAP